MCRWFAYISPEEPCLLTDVLITPANAISKQVSEHYLPHLLPHDDDRDLGKSKDWLIRIRNALLNIDGFGVAWYTSAAAEYIKGVSGTRPAVYKSIRPPSTDPNFRSLCDNTETRCLFAHVRASSGTPVVESNNHPFVFGRHIIMHNGSVLDFSRVRRQLAEHLDYDTFSNIHGSTDSEHVAALYVSLLTKGGSPEAWQKAYTLEDMRAALSTTIKTVLKLQRDVLGDKAGPSSLNLCVTDGVKMVAVRFRNHETEQPPSLYWSNTAGRTLNRKYPGHPDKDVENSSATKPAETHGKHFIVASEPTTFDEEQWTLIKRNYIIAVDAHGGHTETRLKYDGSLNFDDPWEQPPPGMWPPHGGPPKAEAEAQGSPHSSAWMWPWVRH